MNETKTVDELIKECENYIKELKTHCVESMFSREYSWRAREGTGGQVPVPRLKAA